MISVCEKPLHSGPYCNLDGYNFVSNCRKISRGGGGSLVENSLQFDTIDELFVMNEKNFESLFINVKEGKATVVCGVIYRSPSDDLKAHQEFKFQPTECLENTLVCVDVWVVLLCFVQSTREIWCTCILVPMSKLAG